jgi:hypothetical protein
VLYCAREPDPVAAAMSMPVASDIRIDGGVSFSVWDLLTIALVLVGAWTVARHFGWV